MKNSKKIQNIFIYALLLISVSACSTISTNNNTSSNSHASNVVGSLIVGAAISVVLNGASSASSVPAVAGGAQGGRSGDVWLVPLVIGVASAAYQYEKKKESNNKITFTPTYYPEQQKEVAGEIIMISQKGQSISMDSSLKLKERHTLRNIPLTLSLVSFNGLISKKIQALQKKNPQAFIQPNYYYYLDGKDDKNKRNIPQYALTLVGLNKNKQRQQLGEGIHIGIIDTPLDRNHPELQKATIRQKNLVTSKGQAHATALAGIIVGSERLQGIVPSAIITSVGAFEEKNKSKSTGKSTSFILAKAFDYIIGERVNILNLSFGSTKADPLMKRLISETLKHNIKIVASVGNDGNNTSVRYPAAFDGVMGITAIDSKSRLYNKANTGKSVDYALPGVNIITSKPGGRYTSISGTSFANAYAAGLIALQLSKNKNLKSLNRYIKDLGESGKDSHFGFGLLQAP